MAQRSVFIRTFGDYPLIRVLDFLLYSRDFDYPLKEIAENAHVNGQTLRKVWPQLLKNNMVIKTRDLAGMELYKLNTNNPIIQKIIDLNNSLCWEYAEQGSSEKKKRKESIVSI